MRQVARKMLERANHTEGFLVVRRINWFSDLPIENPACRGADREPALGLSNEQVLSMYRGVDGVPWPEVNGVNRPALDNGLALRGEHEKALSYFSAASKPWTMSIPFRRAWTNPLLKMMSLRLQSLTGTSSTDNPRARGLLHLASANLCSWRLDNQRAPSTRLSSLREVKGKHEERRQK
jgi:hypothetical protein